MELSEIGVYGRIASAPSASFPLSRMQAQTGRFRLWPSGSPNSKIFESWL